MMMMTSIRTLLIVMKMMTVMRGAIDDNNDHDEVRNDNVDDRQLLNYTFLVPFL